MSKIIIDLLTNCKDLKLEKENEEELEIEDLNLIQTQELKKNMTINNRLNFTKLEKKNPKIHQALNPFTQSMNVANAQMQNQLFAGTNVEMMSKKKLIKLKVQIQNPLKIIN